MESFFDRIARLPHNKLALLAAELYQRSRSHAAEPIAITAMACRFPGDAETPDAFWSFLERGGDAIERVPEDRLALIGRSAADIAGEAPIWGGFLRQVDAFDPGAFGISAKEAEMMDPQQRLLLEVVWEALENTGTPIDAVDAETGVFIGVSGIDFAMISLEADLEPNGYMLTGAAHCVIAGRLSYVFGLNGPSTVLDTACAAAASAIHLACQSLRAGECSQAIAGGINLLLVPELVRMLETMQVMARDGRCKVFSADADGFVRAEGCGVIVLRRLSDAMARGEPILGVIRGTAWNQDGKSGGLTAPNGAAQERVIRAALADAKLSPDQVSYVEAHGTGTALGDPIEVSALGRVFATGTRRQKLTIGSVKTNIGHLEAAAGMPSVIKVLLALQHEAIPPHLHAAALNPRLDWDALPLQIPTQAIAWPRGPEPRIAGVSAFGISGTNVHMVIAEPPPMGKPEALAAPSRTLLTLSAKSREALAALAGRYAEALAQRGDVDIAAFTAAANLKRAHFSHRLALIVAHAGEAARELRRFSQGDAGSQARSAFVAGHQSSRTSELSARAQELVDRVRAGAEDEALDELASAYLAGAAVNWGTLHAGQKVDPTPLPNYAFQRQRLWPDEFTKLDTSHRRSGTKLTGAAEGLYRVEWQQTTPLPRPLPTLPRFAGEEIVMLHRHARSARAARSALEAGGLRVLERPIGSGGLARTEFEGLATAQRDASWLYLLPSGVGGEELAGADRAALDDLLVIAQVLLEMGPAAPPLRVVTMSAQSAGPTIRPANAALWGLGRVLAAEAPDVRTMFIDLDAGAPDWDSLVDTIVSGRTEPELALLNGDALTPSLVPFELPAPSAAPLAIADGSYIVTGAFGFIGGLTTRWLVRQGAGKLFLVGHNPPREKALAAIEAARAAGTEVELVITDIGSAAGVDALFARVRADARPLKGIIHSAGALDDAAISRQTPASLSHALGAKAMGAWLLHERSVGHRLDFFVLYSSAAALVGTPGQANYAAANCYLDALAHYRRALGLTALSLNWGLWTETGLAIKREVVQSGAAMGAIPITPEQGMAILGRAIGSGETQVAVLPFDLAALRRMLAGRRAPTLLRGLLPAPDETVADETTGSALLARYAETLAACSDAERSGVLIDFIRERCAELLGLDAASPIPDELPLLDLGLDSLVGLELRNDLQRLAEIGLPSTLFFECPTFADLARYFQLVLAAPPATATPHEAYERISV
jgi:acyl transferase domain-containing protein/acyl carrier protein